MPCFVHFDLKMRFAPQRPAIFDIGTSKSGPILVCFLHFDLKRAACLRTCCFSEPTFRPSRPGNHRKNRGIRDFPSISRACIFFLLTFAHLYLLSPDSTFLLCFSSLQIVGSPFDKYVCTEPGRPGEVSERKVREYRLSARRPTNEMPKPRFLCAGLHPFGVVVAFSRLVAGCVYVMLGSVSARWVSSNPCFLLFFFCLLFASSTATIGAQCSMPERTSEQIAVEGCLPQASLQTPQEKRLKFVRVLSISHTDCRKSGILPGISSAILFDILRISLLTFCLTFSA